MKYVYAKSYKGDDYSSKIIINQKNQINNESVINKIISSSKTPVKHFKNDSNKIYENTKIINKSLPINNFLFNESPEEKLLINQLASQNYFSYLLALLCCRTKVKNDYKKVFQRTDKLLSFLSYISHISNKITTEELEKMKK